MPPLSRLYKYETLSARTLQNLKAQALYFGSPSAFNDPYDCALTPSIKVPTDGETEAIRSVYLSREINERQQYEFKTKSTQDLREMLLRAAQTVIKQTVEASLKSCGITCFSQKNDDLLMWSHYGGQYRGICLEFDAKTDPLSKAKPVKYMPSLPQLDVAAILLGDDFDIVGDLYCTKSASWSYECEWRALHKVAGTRYIYPAEALTGIYFGPDIDNESLEIVCLILAGQNESVRFYKGIRSTTEFRVLFEEFTYTSYVQAKKLGLR